MKKSKIRQGWGMFFRVSGDTNFDSFCSAKTMVVPLWV